jgi:RNA polymerase sigma-70 factor (ECF subfamily)
VRGKSHFPPEAAYHYVQAREKTPVRARVRVRSAAPRNSLGDSIAVARAVVYNFVVRRRADAFGFTEVPPLSTTSPHEVTRLLVQLTDGDHAALDALLPLVYAELRRLAAGYLRRERHGHTLQPTALVHEAYLRMIDQTQVRWQNRAHFFGVAAQMMRRILVDHARSQQAEKRGGDMQKLSLDENIDVSGERASDLVALDEALQRLAEIDPQKSRVVELRFFGGLSVEETAEVLGVSAPTVKRQWRMAKAWLFGQVQKQ